MHDILVYFSIGWSIMAAKNSVELSDKAETGSATRSESVGSERERLRNNSSPFWRPMVDAFHSIDSYEMIWLGIFGLATMVLPLISLIDMVNNSTNDHQGKPLVLFTVLLTIIFIFTALSVSLVLIFVTNDWSVSVMLAQRWNPVSYVATYFITALCHFASAWVCAVYVMRHMNGHDDPEWKICCATLSFIFIALSQLFPPAIKVKPEDLGLGELNTDNNNIAFATIVTTTGTEIIPTLLPFPKNFEFLSTVIHFALRLTGMIISICAFSVFSTAFSK